MEARDLGDTITFYLPQGNAGAEAFAVFQDRQHLGGFPTREESLQFALARARVIRETRAVPIRLRIEDDAGVWLTRDALAEPIAAASE
ncbi:hypothetical protein [Luteibacter sp. 9133]|uniref:hypothetical protein n=1 Tax=Luteibacter sp. 9133 TaxID=1500891 RepID=UPI0005BD164B|nr:hypothetical protein [Luteibacter sp. 9133]